MTRVNVIVKWNKGRTPGKHGTICALLKDCAQNWNLQGIDVM